MIDLSSDREKWQKDPLLCTYTLFLPPKAKLYRQQEEIIVSACTNIETAVRSYHGGGKTYTAALADLTFLFINENSKVITTAPSWSQVRYLLWANIRNIWKNSNIYKELINSGVVLPNVLETFFKLDEEWFIIGISPKIEKGEDVNRRMTGFHALKILINLDEGPAVHPAIWAATETLMTSANVHRLSIGNPVDSSGEFYKLFQDSSVSRIVLDIFRNPNFVANGITSLDKLKELANKPIDKQNKIFAKMEYPYPALTVPPWAIKMLKKWGITSPLFLSRVLSQFPTQAKDSMISLADLEACKNELIESKPGPNVIGCDVARFGDDDTVILGFKHWKEYEKQKYNGNDTKDTSNRIIAIWNQTKRDPKERYNIIAIDDIGIGGGVTDNLRDHFKNVVAAPRILGVNVSEAPSQEYEDTCATLTTELFKRIQLILKERGIGINDDGELFAQLLNRKYSFNNKGLIQIESKDDYKSRTGAGSPDEGDALLLCIYALTYANQITSIRTMGDRISVRADW